jgi:putative DeoR family transcriptional regulator (stage III sporulation protein D)
MCIRDSHRDLHPYGRRQRQMCIRDSYIIDSKDTVRGAAKKFGVSKSTVHKDVSERLLKINPILAHEVREILDENKAERHIRGGMATKLKYSHHDKEAI